jgi:excisionase family DNA binding protein
VNLEDVENDCSRTVTDSLMLKLKPNPERRLLRVKSAANYLSVSKRVLRRFIQEGQIPIVQYGENAAWLLDLHDLDRWIEQHKVTR